MSLLGIDLGGTKAAFALFNTRGEMMSKESFLLGRRKGKEVGKLITSKISSANERLMSTGEKVESIGVSVPGISRSQSGTVWAPNIEGWEDYPLLSEIKKMTGDIPVTIDSDRSCSIMGELWKGNARGCMDAIFLTVGTGIGAGILADGEVLRGSDDIAGAIGWMALARPFREKYRTCGCFEFHSSGTGLARSAMNIISKEKDNISAPEKKLSGKITAQDLFNSFENGEKAAKKVIKEHIENWGMAVANLVSIFNPEKIIFGGGVFGPARQFIPQIRSEAEKWAQPLAMKKVSIEVSALSGDAALYGAGFLALRKIKDKGKKLKRSEDPDRSVRSVGNKS